MIGPRAEQSWPINATGVIKWRAINDFGGITNYAQQ